MLTNPPDMSLLDHLLTCMFIATMACIPLVAVWSVIRLYFRHIHGVRNGLD